MDISIGRRGPGLPEARLAVRLRPRGRGDALLGIVDGVLQARVSAPPVDGRANRALCKLIAKRVGVAGSKVRVVRGERSRDKLVAIEGVEEAQLLARLGD